MLSLCRLLRLPGDSDLALVIYSLITLALYKLIPITLTCQASPAFALVGMAVDANILSLKDARGAAGRGLTGLWMPGSGAHGLDSGFECLCLDHLRHLWVFGNSWCELVKGFAVTLALGVAVVCLRLSPLRGPVRVTFMRSVAAAALAAWYLGETRVHTRSKSAYT